MLGGLTIIMKQKIKEIADIQIGYQFRGKIEADPNGTYKVIQIRDFDEFQNLGATDLYKINLKYDAERYIVNKGDILFLARGHRNYAIPIKESLVDTIAASYFFILRLRNENILPEYLAWFIMQAPAQAYLHNIARRGTHMPMVPKSAFENLPIDIPDIETQKTIIKLDTLLEKERSLLGQLQEKRTQLIKVVCLKAVKKKNNEKQEESND
jgi:restriction endonuclease S subunit